MLSHFSIVIYIESFKDYEQSLTWLPCPPPPHPRGKAKDFPYLFPHSQPQRKTPSWLSTHKCGGVSALSLPVLGLIVSTELPFPPKHFCSLFSFPQQWRVDLWALVKCAKNEHRCGVDSTGEDWTESIPAQESSTTGRLVLNLGSVLSDSPHSPEQSVTCAGASGPPPVQGLWVLTQNSQLLA